jgi:hypothetical protein
MNFSFTSEVWEVRGYLNGEDFVYKYTSFDTFDPEKRARELWAILKPYFRFGTLRKYVKHEEEAELVEELRLPVEEDALVEESGIE